MKHLKFVKKNFKGNIVFLVNRLDRYKKDVDSIKNTLMRIKEDLERIGFSEPVVYPISAYAGYLGKMVLYGETLNEDELDDFEFVKRKLKKEEFSYEQYYPVMVDRHDVSDEIGELLLHSGILSLERILY